MYGGELLENGSSSSVLAHSRHPYTGALLRAIPTIDGPRRRLATIPGNRRSADGAAESLCVCRTVAHSCSPDAQRRALRGKSAKKGTGPVASCQTRAVTRIDQGSLLPGTDRECRRGGIS